MLCFCHEPDSLSSWGQNIETKANSRRQSLWLSIERSRTNWYKIAKRIATKQFKSELESLKLAIKMSPTVRNTLLATETFLLDQLVVKDWEKALIAIYLPVSENFGKITLDNLKCSNLNIETKTGDNFDLWKSEVLRWLQNSSSTKIVQIMTTTRSMVRNELTKGVDLGESIDDLAKRIDSLYLEQIIPHRSEVISRTEVISASNLGSRAAAIHTGLLLNHEWLASGDSRTRFDHSAVDGQSQPLNLPFVVAGDELMFPGDSSLGASASNTIQCRCAETYQVATEG